MKDLVSSKTKCLTIFCLAVFLLKPIVAQVSPDCKDALFLCERTFTQNTIAAGGGLIDDLPFGSSFCLDNGENNSSWYRIEIDSSGSFMFDIQPLGMVDYDYSVWDITNLTCQDISNGSAQELRCNYDFGQGVTGLRPGFADTISGPAGSQFLAPIQVTQGQVLMLLVDNFTTGNTGYTLDLDPSTAIFNSSGNVNIEKVTGNACSDTITVFLDREIQVSSISPSYNEFVLIDTSRSVVGGYSGNNSTSSVFHLILDAPLGEDTFQLAIGVGSDGDIFENKCGFAGVVEDTITFHVDTPFFGVDFIFNGVGGGNVTFNDISVGLESRSWDMGDGTIFITGSKMISHRFATNGIYNVCLSAFASCGRSRTVCKEVNVLSVGVRKMKDGKDFNIYFSITEKILVIGSAGHISDDNGEISIYNMMGQQMYSDEVLLEEYKMDCTFLNSGFYLVVIRVDGDVYTKKIAIR